MTPTFKNISVITALAVLAFFTFLMLRIVIPYRTLETDIAFLQLKQAFIHIDVWRISFFIHVFTSTLVLFAGFTQFSKKLLKNKPKLHRRLGYIYVGNILLITGPSGLIMSFYANGGILSIIGFIILSILWMSTTGIALYKAINKDFIGHRMFMIRSFALTLSAISLRAEKVLFAEFTDIAPMDRYRIIAWLGWGLNLLIAEIIIYNLRKKKKALKLSVA
ncbi:MAG: DUF2306 domain-containing protein [Bacteroidota bacterium]